MPELGAICSACHSHQVNQGAFLQAFTKNINLVPTWCRDLTRDLWGLLGLFERDGRDKDVGLLEMTLPNKPRSSKQKYRLTAKGRAVLESQHPRN